MNKKKKNTMFVEEMKNYTMRRVEVKKANNLESSLEMRI